VKNEQISIEGINQMETRKGFEDKNKGLAAVLSLMLPGVGQFYTGHFIWGIVWFIITPGLWLGTGGTLGWIFHIISSIQAYRQARRTFSQ
jgi:TM2 domain-containing membrane protein YozV